MKEALKLALDALTYIYTETTADEDELIDQAITALRLAIDVQNMASESTYKAALAQPEQETDHGDELTIAYMSGVHRGKELAAQQCLDCGSNNIGIFSTYDSLIDSVKTSQASA